MDEFKFNESKNVSCIVCKHIVKKERTINLVTHDEGDGQWGFLCGEPGHQTKDYMLISLSEVIKIDKSVNDLFEMPLGHCATREDINDKWKPFKQ